MQEGNGSASFARRLGIVATKVGEAYEGDVGLEPKATHFLGSKHGYIHQAFGIEVAVDERIDKE